MEALAQLLDQYGVEFDPSTGGNQQICCPHPDHDDSSPSCSLNLDKGLLNCFGCGFRGTVVDLLMALEGLDLREALAKAEGMADGTGWKVSTGGRAGRAVSGGKRSRGSRSYIPPWVRS